MFSYEIMIRTTVAVIRQNHFLAIEGFEMSWQKIVNLKFSNISRTFRFLQV